MSVGDVVSGSSLSSCAGRHGGRTRTGAARGLGARPHPARGPGNRHRAGRDPASPPGTVQENGAGGDPGTGCPHGARRRELGRKPRFPEGAFSGSRAPGLDQNPRAHGPGAVAGPRAALSHTLLSPHVPSQPLTHAPWHGRVPRRTLLAPAPFPPCSHARTHARPSSSHAPAPARLRAPFPRPRLSPTAGAAGCRRPPQQERIWGGGPEAVQNSAHPRAHGTGEGAVPWDPSCPPQPLGSARLGTPWPCSLHPGASAVTQPRWAPLPAPAQPGRAENPPPREPARRGPTAAVLWGARGSATGHRLCWELPHGHVGSVPAPQPLVSCSPPS